MTVSESGGRMREIFNIRQMEAFRAVIKHGSISRAASSLFITQSAVSKLISALEEDAELRLFERHSGRLQPTSAALRLYEHSDRVFAELSQLNREIKLLKGESRRVFSVGVLPALASQYSAEVCRFFREKNADIHISLVTGNTPSIKEMLISRKLDVGVISTPIDHPSFVARPVLSSSLVCVLPLGHPLAGQEVIHAQDLHQFDFVDYNPDDQCSALQSKIFDQCGCSPRFAIDGTTASVVINLVASGFGVGLVHPASAYWRRKDLCIKPFVPQTPISYYFCHGNETHNADLIQSFAECMSWVYCNAMQGADMNAAWQMPNCFGQPVQS
jgi:DNA-binding transcriptional LysR family regulator